MHLSSIESYRLKRVLWHQRSGTVIGPVISITCSYSLNIFITKTCVTYCRLNNAPSSSVFIALFIAVVGHPQSQLQHVGWPGNVGSRSIKYTGAKEVYARKACMRCNQGNENLPVKRETVARKMHKKGHQTRERLGLAEELRTPSGFFFF